MKKEVVDAGKRVIQAVEKSLQELRKLWEEESVDFKFSSEMCHDDIQVLSNGKEIKKKKGY